MEIIPGYWDPRNLCFIEDAELIQLDGRSPLVDPLRGLLEICSSGGASRAKHKSCVSGASAAGPETADACCNKKKC